MKAITLANGKQVIIKQYVAGIMLAKANPEKTFPYGLTGWWPVKGREIVEQFYGMVQDHCNRGLTISDKDPHTAVIKAYRKGRTSNCKNCGDEFLRHNPFNDNDRFCSDRCRIDYWW